MSSSDDIILLSTGFLVKASDYFTTLETQDSFLKQIRGDSANSVLSKYVKKDVIYYSNTAINLHKEYKRQLNAASYLDMVKLMSGVLTAIPVRDFLLLQACNTTVTPVVFELAYDIVTGDVNPFKYTTLNALPRFIPQGSTGLNKMHVYESMIDKLTINDWVRVIGNLASKRESFLASYTYMLLNSEIYS